MRTNEPIKKYVELRDKCDKCGELSIMNNTFIKSMQLKDGKATAYKTLYKGEKDKGCNPCEYFSEKELEQGAIECDFYCKPIC